MKLYSEIVILTFNNILERLISIYYYIKNLHFEEDPDYDYIIFQFKEILSTMKSRTYTFDWQKNNRSQDSLSRHRNLSVGGVIRKPKAGTLPLFHIEEDPSNNNH